MPLTLRKQTELEIEVEEHGTFRAVGLPLDAVTTADLLGIITSLEEAATVEDLRRVTDLCASALAEVIDEIRDVTDLGEWPELPADRLERLRRWPSSILIPFAVQWAIGDTAGKSKEPSDGPR